MELQPDGAQGADSNRSMIAMMVIMAMMLLWGVFMRPTAPPPKADDPDGKPSTAKAAGTATPPEIKPATDAAPTSAARPGTATKPDTATKPATHAKPGTAVPPKPLKPKPTPEPPAKIVVKRGRLFTARFTNIDGALDQLLMHDFYRTPPDKQKALRRLAKDPDADVSAFGLPILGQPGTADSLVLLDPYEPSDDKKTEKEDGNPGELSFPSRRYGVAEPDDRTVVFTATFAGGQLEVTKTFRLPAPGAKRQREIEVEIRLKNLGEAAVELPGYALRGCGGIAVDLGPKSWKQEMPSTRDYSDAARYMGAAVAMENEQGETNVKRLGISKFAKRDLVGDTGKVLWAAAHTNYFAVVLEPRPEDDEKWVRSGSATDEGEHNLTCDIQTAKLPLDPGQAVTHKYRLFAGPKTRSELEANGYAPLYERGWLDPLVKVMSFILDGVYAIIPNYGIAILCLTFLVRLVMHPLTKKSQTAMQKMQKLQPQMKEIREKYKNDKRRQQEELMKLHREYGVNPLGGCFPILLQLPIFIGLFTTLRQSMGLRHAPFLFVQDLSQPDNFLGMVNILPLISCAIMFIQQRMMPKSTDPQQAQTQKIMGYMMPVMIGWIFYSFPSGLALYFIASTCVGLLEQKMIKRHLAQEGDLKPVNAGAKKPTKPTPKPTSGRKRKSF